VPPVANRPWLVTRPAAAGESLTAALRAAGCDARWLPAFDLGPAPDPQAAQAVLARLASFDLAVLVSPAAVRATAALVDGRWPGAVPIGAVGRGTVDAVRACFGAAPTVIAPDVGAEVGSEVASEVASNEPTTDGADDAVGRADPEASGSEAFWQALTQRTVATGRAPREVLLLRAEQGRDWLRAHFEAVGARVTLLAVYRRTARAWDGDDRAWIAGRRHGPSPVLVVTSSEAVDALLAAADAMPDAAEAAALRAWLQRGRALALHPRIVERLHAAGFADAACVPCVADALLAAAG
jgi:uroporphyrinogen-III synthase